MNVLHAGSEEGEEREEGVWSLVAICQPTNRGGSLGDSGARQWCSCCMWVAVNALLSRNIAVHYGSRFTHQFGLLGPFSRGELAPRLISMCLHLRLE